MILVKIDELNGHLLEDFAAHHLVLGVDEEQANEIGGVLAGHGKLSLLGEQLGMRIVGLSHVGVAVLDEGLSNVDVAGLGLLDGANVVGLATAAREGHIIKWGLYCKKMVPATLMVVLIAMFVIYFRYL